VFLRKLAEKMMINKKGGRCRWFFSEKLLDFSVAVIDLFPNLVTIDHQELHFYRTVTP
jgi:hypothetical protein